MQDNDAAPPRLRRDKAAHFLTESGYPTSPNTLAKYATVGGGPPYILYGRIPLYEPVDLIAWARDKCSEKITRYAEKV